MSQRYTIEGINNYLRKHDDGPEKATVIITDSKNNVYQYDSKSQVPDSLWKSDVQPSNVKVITTHGQTYEFTPKDPSAMYSSWQLNATADGVPELIVNKEDSLTDMTSPSSNMYAILYWIIVIIVIILIILAIYYATRSSSCVSSAPAPPPPISIM